MRLLLTLASLAVALGAYALLLKGWRSRLARQADLTAPVHPTGDAVVLDGPFPGLFVGTTRAASWLDRITAHHLSHRSAAELVVAEDGVRLARPALPALLVPYEDLVSADVETALGGKVVSTGMLVLTWRLGRDLVRTAFRADDREVHERVRTLLTARIALEASR